MFTSDWAAEAIRLHRRYLIEIVEELGFCPWARRARLEGHTREKASGAADADEAVDESATFVDEITADERIEVAFLLFPRLELPRLEFDAVGARVNAREAARHPPGRIPFMLAAFHPDARADTTTPERFIPYLRRTPDPCLQLVRASVLDAVRDKSPQGTQLVDPSNFDFTKLQKETPLRERIARANLDTASELGLAELARRLDDIHADRDRSYEAYKKMGR